eukprot:gene28794-31982_t
MREYPIRPHPSSGWAPPLGPTVGPHALTTGSKELRPTDIVAPYQREDPPKSCDANNAEGIAQDRTLEWRSSKYSLSGADGILNKQHQGSASVKAAELTKRLLQLLKDAESLASLKLVVQGLRLHMTPTVLVEAIAKVPRTSEDTARGKPQVTKEQLLDLLLPLLQPHIATLTTHRLIMVAGSLSFAKYTPSPEVGGALLKQFAGPSGASRLRDASVGDLVHLIMSAPFLGWDSLDLWDRFSRAAKDRLKAMNAAQLAGALRAMCGMDARSVHAKAFWAQAREEVGMRHKELAKDEAVALAAMLKCISAAATAGLGRVWVLGAR